MALINRIEIVNYLSEGWEPSMGVANWRPLWPANIINLCGASTAIQIPNGGGKTSLTNAVLYLLSQDRVLKRRFLERCSPAGMVATHIRIEFAILHDQDLTQRDLMVPDPQFSPAETHVIGVCANRGDDNPRFYRYSGALEDVPAHRIEGTSIVFTTASALQAGVKNIRGQWNIWNTSAEWGKVVGMFMSQDVVRQNVMFHRDGAGDASAAFSKVMPATGERFDEAYFRQVVAPQLLTNVMGDSAEEDERNIEDTILRSMGRFIDAKLQVEGKEAYLRGREALELEFRPVLEAAGKIETARAAYQTQLQTLAVDAAFLAHFVDSKDASMAGVPRDLGAFSLRSQVRDCLKTMALDNDGSVLIESAGLAALMGISTGRLNEIAGRSSASQPAVPHRATSSQVIDLYCDSKILEGHGGRRNALRFYDLQSSRELASRRSENPSEALAVLDDAFEFARTTVDTNVFRHELRRLAQAKAKLKESIAQAEQEGRDADADKERLEKQVTEWKDNQGAYQEFCEHLHLIPTDFHDSPGLVPEWLGVQTQARTEAVSLHNKRVGELTAGWDELRQVLQELGLISIEDRISELNAEQRAVQSNKAERETEALNAQKERDDAATTVGHLRGEIAAAASQLGALSEHMQAFDTFITIFGDVDPLKVGPPLEENEKLGKKKLVLEGQRRTKVQALDGMQRLSDATRSFKQLFGEIDPRLASPQRDYNALLEAQSASQAEYQYHQPLTESLEAHLESTGQDPTIWLRKTDAAHSAALDKSRAAGERIKGLDLELAALNDLEQVGNVDFATAHNSLKAAGLHVSRVLDVILGLELPKDDALPLLAALGPLLDAPVASEMTQAETALNVLQHGDHDVPLFLLEPLVAQLKRGPDQNNSTTATLGFFAGVKSRRMRAILDPQALAEEREALAQKRQEEQERHDAAMSEAELHTPHTDAYRQALHAQDAVKRGSLERAKAAHAENVALEKRLDAAKRLITAEALSLLQDAKKFVEAGGDDALGALGMEIDELTAELATLDERLAAIAGLLTQQAIVAHDGARRFVQGGGHQTFRELKDKRVSLERQVAAFDAAMPGLEAKLSKAQSDHRQAVERALGFMSTFQNTMDRLTRARSFQADGRAAFMETQARVLAELEQARDALDPLRSIKYERAQAFKQHQGQDVASLQRQIGEARARRASATSKAHGLVREAEALEGSIVEAGLAADALHELAYFLCNRRNAAAPFEEDLRSRETGASRAEAHEAYEAAEALRWRLREWRPNQGPFDRTSIGVLRAEVEAIDIARTGKEVDYARKLAARAQSDFQRVREVFCNKARSSADGGFSEGEIDAIQSANTSEELSALAAISSRLRDQLATEKSELEELKQSTELIEKASIETLTRLVETCKSNLATMNFVMARNPKARFTIQAEVISTEDIKRLMEDLRDHIEARKRDAKARQKLTRNVADTHLGSDIRRALIERIFMKPSVEFVHVGMWDGRSRPVQAGVSEGQKSALQMLWLIRESEYHLECAVRRHLGGGAKKKLRSRSQRVLFFDGLFSNLTDRRLIDEAFKGLGEADSNLQLVGLIHNTEYRNNSKIFPSYVVGRRVGNRDVEGERSYVRFEDNRPEGSMGLATFMHKRQPPNGEALNG
jgi:hypothetical protein